jgi:hypothetical protein
MRRLYFFTPRQIRNRARQFKDAMIGARREIHLTHYRPRHALTLILQPAILPDLPDRMSALLMMLD